MADDAIILITGSSGQLGSELKDLKSLYPDYKFIFFSREELSITDEDALRNTFEKTSPDYLINCAAYTAVDNAEAERDEAIAINATAVGMLAALCEEYDTHFLHISTDYVFDGNSKTPLKEADKIDPVNFYGQSKLEGEELALKNNPDTIIIRTSWVYSSYGKNFVKTMMRLMKEKESIGVVNDQIGSPTYAADLANAIVQIINSGKWTPGIYNYSNEGVINWYEFAVEIKNLIHSNCIVNPTTTEQYPTPAKRPAFSVLDKTKIQQTFGIQLKDWKESLKTCIKKLQSA